MYRDLEALADSSRMQLGDVAEIEAYIDILKLNLSSTISQPLASVTYTEGVVPSVLSFHLDLAGRIVLVTTSNTFIFDSVTLQLLSFSDFSCRGELLGVAVATDRNGTIFSFDTYSSALYARKFFYENRTCSDQMLLLNASFSSTDKIAPLLVENGTSILVFGPHMFAQYDTTNFDQIFLIDNVTAPLIDLQLVPFSASVPEMVYAVRITLDPFLSPQFAVDCIAFNISARNVSYETDWFYLDTSMYPNNSPSVTVFGIDSSQFHVLFNNGLLILVINTVSFYYSAYFLCS